MRGGVCKVLLLFTVLLLSADAQSVIFDQVAVPASKHLLSIFRFFVFSPSDPPALVSRWGTKLPFGVPHPPDPIIAAPPETGSDSNDKLYSEVIFRELRLAPTDLNNKTRTVQLTLINNDDFNNIIIPMSMDPNSRFCCNPDDVVSGACKEEDTFLRPDGITDFFTTSVGSPAFTFSGVRSSTMQGVDQSGKHVISFRPESTGMYILLYTNCGVSIADATVSGSVYLRNYYGYLPGIEVSKISLYAILSIFYALLVLLWVILSVRRRDQLIYMHHAIAFVLVTGLVEASVWFVFYRRWNMDADSTRSNILLSICTILSVSKNILSFMLVLVASLGWGITRPTLDTSTKRKIALVIVAYVVFDSARQIMTQFRLSHELSFFLAISCILPVSILHGVIFFWIFSSLGKVMEELSETRQMHKLQFFARFWVFLMISLFVTIGFLFIQIFMISQDSSSRWRQEWMFSDLFPHMLFLSVLIAMLYLWAPNRNSKRMAFSSELPSEDPLEAEMRGTAGRGEDASMTSKAGGEEVEIPVIGKSDATVVKVIDSTSSSSSSTRSKNQNSGDKNQQRQPPKSWIQPEKRPFDEFEDDDEEGGF